LRKVSTTSRRTALAVTRTADAETVTCFCGGTEYDYGFVRFPMTHVSRCRACGLEHRCELQIAPARKAETRPPDQPLGFPPFWY
jgi:hypothetical protein